MVKVLIVEDETIVIWHIQRVLENLGHIVVASVTSGVEAIQMALEVKPDLVLMDIRLDGEMDGITAAEEIYKRFDIPTVYVTAHADESTLRRAIATSPFGYLVKPFQGRELHVAIEVALQRHRLEQQLRASQHWLTNALVSIGDGTIAVDREGKIQFMNPAAETLTGWQQQEAMGMNINRVLTIVDPDTGQLLESPLNQAMQQGTRVSLPTQCLLRTKDGSERPISDSAAPIKNLKGEIIGSVAVFQDNSEQQRTQAEMRQRITTLEQNQIELIAQLQAQATQIDQAIDAFNEAIREIRES